MRSFIAVIGLLVISYVAMGYECCKGCKMPNPFPPSLISAVEVRAQGAPHPCMCGCGTNSCGNIGGRCLDKL